MHLYPCLIPPLLAATALAASIGGISSRQSTTGYELKKGPLDTPWTEKVGTNPWPEYPRPLLQRKSWKNLNGVWQLRKTDKDGLGAPPFGVDLDKFVLVPFCLESALSGIMETDMIWTWYRTTFDVPSDWPAGDRVLLNFGAVDYEATVFVNGKKVTTHTGGYWAFTVDITDQLSKDGANELLVHVYDPTDKDDIQIPIGKQTLSPSHIFYTPCSGIWQTVWLESAPSTHISEMHTSADMDGKVTMTVSTNDGSNTPVEVFLFEPDSTTLKETHIISRAENMKHAARGSAGSTFEFTVPSIRRWSPGSPKLYPLQVKVGNDTVESYLGFRTISRGVINGIQRPLLNGEFLFHFGTLDQGFWPDGIYSPPSKEAMVFDLETLKKIGYNMIKVEPALFYQACDQMGLLVIQDMPSLRTRVPNPKSTRPKECGDSVSVGDPKATEEFSRQLEIMVNQLKSYPSIYTWTIYNEDWGQPADNGDTERKLTSRIREHDPTRLVNTVSGWFDHGAGDFHDNHHYANPQCGAPFYSKQADPYDSSRIALQGEFAGIGHIPAEENIWQVRKAREEAVYTYEINADINSWNYRAHVLLRELREQIERYACSGAVWTQTTDVEGEVNGMTTYDRRVLRPDLEQWGADVKALYETAQRRVNGTA
ncbi:glycoside hydrolase family 2 protein [Sporormia fimetaria CBS 119925]|uniref:Glycoside hydrolase family 2 protein n=1 Tax=Sporormia fimetaria CBS 119925 TaxID=1340428 RepID=A0A6A6UZ63_9PLEO|nr:glycoside hydrolase family 2 protein [Sporormia fimetaria CBS 119925]